MGHLYHGYVSHNQMVFLTASTSAEERKLMPDVITYNAAINACAQSGECLGSSFNDFGTAKIQSCVPSVPNFWLDWD